MARETRARLEARLDAERRAAFEKYSAEWQDRLMSNLERANKFNSNVYVEFNMFVVELDDVNRFDQTFKLPLTLAYATFNTPLAQMEDFQFSLDELEEARASELRRAELRKTALAKLAETLNKEEREALGL